MLDRKTKTILFQLARSHSNLAQAEYVRNPRGFHAMKLDEIEGKFVDYLKDMGLYDEFFVHKELAEREEGRGR
jgi:hypothetical protein